MSRPQGGNDSRGTRSGIAYAFRWLILLPALASGQLQAAECRPWVDSKTQALTFGDIAVNVGDLFDPAQAQERHGIHRLGNALHFRSRETTILQALPFRRGDDFSLALIGEGERALRARQFLRDARIVPTRQCGNEVDVEVRTVDNWTLTPSISYGTAGGVSRYIVELQDLNVLGLGKELKLRLQKIGGERETIFVYGDNNVFGSQHRLRFELSDADDGKRYLLKTGLPFNSINSLFSWWVTVRVEDESLALAELSEEGSEQDSVAGSASTSSVDPEATVNSGLVDLHGARKMSNSTNSFLRLGLGLRFSQQETRLPDDAATPATGFDYEEHYPYLYAHWKQLNWVQRKNYLAMGFLEDIDLGYSARFEAGFILGALGNDYEGLRLSSTLTRGWQFSEAALHNVSLQLVSYLDDREQARHSEIARYRYFRWLTPIDQIELQVVAGSRRSYSPLHDFRLGGEAGLKGYPKDYQQGNERVVAVAEYRHVTRWNPYRLAHIGFTGFAEAGRVTSDDRTDDGIADIGIGLVLAPTRSSQFNIMRIDIAVPLVSGEGVDDYQLFVGTRLVY
ncbi:MAG: hypothetical protein V3U76_10150 [Granulosicoccus sp.]